ncbi:MAG: PPOX class F420-dependent oxidoreductase [Thermomicrobiales bacterium]|nr:PPOX class F420-dependent oxidoreductase [Thermomicrobiales bacterium]
MANLTDEQRRYLEDVRFAVLATMNPSGTPQQTVMWYYLDGDDLVMNTMRGRKKDRNLLLAPRASACVEDGYRYLTLTGPITLDDDPVSAQVDIARLATRYHGREQAEQMMRDDFSKQERVTLRLAIEGIDAHGFGGDA